MDRIILAALSSGSGKTTITCGLLAAYKKRGIRVGSVKCGPDYIDPMFHRKVLGIPSGNLDCYFTLPGKTRSLMAEKAAAMDLMLLEGVMGYYDGLGGQTETASTYELQRITKTPVILVVDGKGASVSLAAAIKGMMDYHKDSNICGILLNRVSASYYERIRQVIEQACGIPVLGFLPEQKELQVPSRHLGLFTPEELEDFESWTDRAAALLEEHADLDAILEIARSAPELDEIPDDIGSVSVQEDICKGIESGLERNEFRKDKGSALERKDFFENIESKSQFGSGVEKNPPVHIAVARDEAFCFYYQENIDLLEKLGAEITYFSPLTDPHLPEPADGLILWGGYPERFAKQLSENETLRAEIKTKICGGLPCLAECGGFLYLQESLQAEDGSEYPMAGVLPGNGFDTGKLCRFGYLEAEALHGGMMGEAGLRLRGHEFHHWDSTGNGTDFSIRKYKADGYESLVHTESLFAGFAHFYYESNPDALKCYLQTCRDYGIRRDVKRNWDKIAKPIDSLGELETLAGKICMAGGSAAPYPLSAKAVAVFCADHGVVEEGVTQTDSSVTKVVSENFAAGKSTVNLLANQAGADVFPVDIGMDTENYPEKRLMTGKIIDRKIRRGTGNLLREAAMTREECLRALQIGTDLARELKEMGYKILATGEMGIGNTTPTAVMAALLTGLLPEQTTGKGAGLSESGLKKKRQVVASAVERIRQKLWEDGSFLPESQVSGEVCASTASGANVTKIELEGKIDNSENNIRMGNGVELDAKKSGIQAEQALKILQEGGGLEIAGMAGLFLGGRKYRIPVIIDGAISAVAAYCAYLIDRRCKDFMIPSHMPVEAGGAAAMKALGLWPIIHGNLCLGEGTGAVMAMPLLDMAMKVYAEMGSFEDYRLEAYERWK